MHRRPRIAVMLAALTLAACSTSSPGHGTGVGAPSTPIASTTSSSLSLPPPSTSATSSSTAPTHSRSTPRIPPTPPPSTSSSTSAGGSTYTVNGNRNTWCGSSQIAVTAAEPSGGAAAGHTGVVLRFLNNSHRQCILYGYPGVDGTNHGGRSIAHATRTLDGPLGGCHCSQFRGVLVQPGQTASALVEGNIGGPGNCDRFSGLLVIPPNTYNATPLNMAPHSCGFEVHPTVTGTDGEG